MSQYGWKNSPDTTRGQVSRLVSALRNRFEKDLIGVYLHGSLAMGCFNPRLSDVDLLAVTKNGIILDTQKAIVEELFKLSNAPTPLEFSLLRSSDLQPWQNPTPYLLHYSEDHREQLTHELGDGAWRNWNEAPKVDRDLAAHVTVLRTRGICVFGEPIEKVFPEVPKKDYLASVMADLEWSKSLLGSNPVYPILNACRVLAYLREGQILSKDEGGRWAIEHLPSNLLPVARSAMSVYSGLYMDMFVSSEKVQEFFNQVYAEIKKQPDVV
jgi:streptomycin 3"-adenylyltransferase